MNRDSNGFITTDSELLGFEVPVLYSGASGINVDNENYVISFTGTAYGSGGKTYQGVAPIVVNNDADKISANTTPFGVQSPLYFAQDDESGCVIGFSGDIDPAILSSKLDVSAFEAWQTGQYTNDIATITNNVSAISSEIPDVSQFVTSSDLSTLSSEITGLIPSTAGLASETYVQQQVSSKLDESAYSTQSGNFLTAIPAEYATQDWVTGQNYLTSVPPEYSTSSDLITLSSDIVSQIPDVSNYATLTDLESTSADITAMIPSTAGLATETYVNENISGKADKSEIPDVSNFITNASAEETYLTKNEASTSYQTIDGMTAYQPLGDYLTADALVPYSADWNTVSSKLDESAFRDVSGTFLTAHQDLSDYATVGLVEETSGAITSLIPDTSDFATTADLSNYYQKTDTSSKSELDYAFSHITGGGSTYTSPLNTIIVDNENSTLEGTDSAYVTDAPIESLISTANGIQQSDTRINGNKLSWDFTVKKEGFLLGTSRINFTAYNEFNQSLTSRQITGSNGTHLVSSYYNPSATYFYATYLITSGNFSAISSYIGSGTVQLARKNELENYQPLSSMSDYALRSWVTANYLSRAGAREAYAKLSALETVSSDITSMIPNTAGLASTTYVDESVSSKLDTSAFSDVSGTFLTAHQSLDGYATTSDLQQTSGNITALIPTDYYPDSNPSGFITGVDLSPYQTTADMVNYQTTAGMTAYQAAGDYATTNELEQVSADITATIPSTAGLASENYVQTNSAVLTGMIDAKQDALTFGYDENDKINSINNSAIGGGGGGNPEVEAYVTSNSGSIDETVSTYQTNSGSYLQSSDISAAEWNDCYDNVSTNSGVWGGSALPISAGPGIKMEVVDNTLVVSNDETLLWSGASQESTATLQLSGNIYDYDYVDIYACPDYNTYSDRMSYQIFRSKVLPQTGTNQMLTYAKTDRIASNTYLSEVFYLKFNYNGTSVSFSPGVKFNNNTVTTGVSTYIGAVTQIVGVNRISGGI